MVQEVVHSQLRSFSQHLQQVDKLHGDIEELWLLWYKHTHRAPCGTVAFLRVTAISTTSVSIVLGLVPCRDRNVEIT